MSTPLRARLGIVAAATALASATALSGAAVASAQINGDTGSVAADGFTAKTTSTLVSERTEDGVQITYTNKTARSLACYGASMPSVAVGLYDAHVKRFGAASMTDRAMEALAATAAEYGQDQFDGRMFLLGPAGTIEGDASTYPENLEDVLVGPGESETWNVSAPSGYKAGAVLVCGELAEDYDIGGDNEEFEGMLFSYAEYVSTNTSGGAGSGSLGSGSLGSTGSVGSTGSLGS